MELLHRNVQDDYYSPRRRGANWNGRAKTVGVFLELLVKQVAQLASVREQGRDNATTGRSGAVAFRCHLSEATSRRGGLGREEGCVWQVPVGEVSSSSAGAHDAPILEVKSS
jgi:hypothetical protein